VVNEDYATPGDVIVGADSHSCTNGAMGAFATGFSYDKTDLENLANKITQQTREFNAREGLGSSADRLPERFYKEKTLEGASLSSQDIDQMLLGYNRIRSSRPKLHPS
jgi:aldehyde:ferredoxin oxidoreductase